MAIQIVGFVAVQKSTNKPTDMPFHVKLCYCTFQSYFEAKPPIDGVKKFRAG